MAAAVRELFDDPAALEAGAQGARRARETLTWEASARMHLDLYRGAAGRVSAAAVGILGAGRQAHETAGYYLALGAEVRFFAANEEFYEAATRDADLDAEVLEMVAGARRPPEPDGDHRGRLRLAAPAVRSGLAGGPLGRAGRRSGLGRSGRVAR